MKKLSLCLMAFAMLFVSATTVIAQSADDIIQKHLTAIGGEANWKKVNSMKMVGAMNANGTEINVTMTAVHNKGMRQDIAVMGMSGYSIVTTKEGWTFFPFQGQTKPEAMTADDVKESQDELDIQGKFVDYKQKGCKVDYLGKDQVEGTECHKIKLTLKSGKEETMYFDATSYYLIKSSQKMKANGKEMEQVSMMSNYQKQPEGIVVPMTINTQGGEITFKTVEINKPVDESVFKPSN